MNFVLERPLEMMNFVLNKVGLYPQLSQHLDIKLQINELGYATGWRTGIKSTKEFKAPANARSVDSSHLEDFSVCQ